MVPVLILIHGTSRDSSTFNSKENLHKDTVVIIQKITDDNIAKNYQQILEKTNTQLSLWWNPYGIFVAMLGVLFALLAIIAVFLIFRQSNEYKTLINKSLDDHKNALDKLITEKNNQLENDKTRLDSLIMEYEEKLKTSGTESKKEINEFISKLKEQKEFIDTEIHIYKHSGWQHKDIPENYPVTQNTIFNARITLNQLNQPFVIYLRVITNDNRKFWLGFSGNTKNTPVKDRTEYTLNRLYNSKEVIINENIISVFNQGFNELNIQPICVDLVRLRGSNADLSEITFSYKIN